MKNVFLLGLVFGVLFPGVLEAKDSQELIDVPTAYTLQRGNFALDFKMYKEGGILTKLSLGFTDYIMLGIPIDVRKAIGDEKAQCDFPLLVCGKIRLIPSRGAIPNITVGFDPYGFSQYGTEWDKLRYLLYISFTKKASFVDFPIDWTIGVNNDLKDFKSEDASLFGGADISLTPELQILADICNIKEGDKIKLNAGIRYLIQPKLEIEVSFKDLSVETPERVIRIGYANRFF
ncbi:MAG: hypothetical protein QME40_02420 [bacterium]|nr:hypothetical protein [bacterium]